MKLHNAVPPAVYDTKKYSVLTPLARGGVEKACKDGIIWEGIIKAKHNHRRAN